ncbi:dof zinc finger protein DOF3.6-like isoform X3 [Canna indica]|uniref:Dof zinc finger protein DOF3.6-like isoform X3 n=1 Tax=Canna indica TaxID=4628 RepID=A0AAQ3JZH8_9LILI|nr:dof zinc finger protein DOF3.6-like isoform X3 [Canna indica]
MRRQLLKVLDYNDPQTAGGDGGSASSSSSMATSSGVGGAIASHLPLPSSQLLFMASLHPLLDFTVSDFGMNFSSNQLVDAGERTSAGQRLRWHQHRAGELEASATTNATNFIGASTYMAVGLRGSVPSAGARHVLASSKGGDGLVGEGMVPNDPECWECFGIPFPD